MVILIYAEQPPPIVNGRMNMGEQSLTRKTKIVCTIGPATADPEMIARLVRAGMNVARLNFSHGDHDSHRKTMENIRTVVRDTGRPVGILQDLAGPKIRLGRTDWR